MMHRGTREPARVATTAGPSGVTKASEVAKIRLLDKVVLVTGFATGLGRELSVYLAREGATVAGFSRRPDEGEETAHLVRAEGRKALFVPTDVRDERQVESGLARVIEAFGGLDVVVNCAGVRVTGTATETSLEQWQTALDTNLTGTFLVSRAAIPELRRRGGGAIVNITTTSALRPSPSRVAHGVSKTAVHMLTESMALDHAGELIRVNCVCPGPTATPLTPSDTRDLTKLAGRMPMRRAGEPRDVAEAVIYLASDAARHVTGAILPVDGGMHLVGGP